jgi:hypothetical protein
MDEMWIHLYAPVKQTSEYGMETSNVTSQEVQNSTGSRKSDVGIIWDVQGPILEHLLETGTTVNHV